eukprot:TRINITY_DN69396_c0_g1_i1.p1 TRINITY_DN69396_c0_g1~~TRINITY_DN69396_c0_g1_i1.p1  ORF type:complete len:359 (-),score=54.86 TRINITY_DN69396_c0_g1_i1:129-1205(-)
MHQAFRRSLVFRTLTVLFASASGVATAAPASRSRTVWKTHYDVLGVGTKATSAEIQRSYRRTALLEHPDKSKRADAESRFRRVASAFEVLFDPSRRAYYDHDLSRGNGADAGESTSSENSVDPHAMFRDHMGNVFEHWHPGDVAEGEIIRNHQRVRIVIHPNGTTDERDTTDSALHRFVLKGHGWCLFIREPHIMAMAGVNEVDCRQKCVDLHPMCEGYAYAQAGRECEIYKREDPPQPIGGVDSSSGVACYQQDDRAFDTSSSILRSEISVTKPDGTQSIYKTVVFCQLNRHALGGSAARAVTLSNASAWWPSVASSVHAVASAVWATVVDLSGGGGGRSFGAVGGGVSWASNSEEM